ncbi:MAG: transcription-repair coupling factor [Bilifractor sp.]|jgi:transcription-repair coupling factor (superfamily II helicase)
MIEALKQPLEMMAGYEDLKKKIGSGSGVIEISGCLDSQKAHIAAGLVEGRPAALLIAENELKARAMYEDFRLFDPDVMYFPRRDLIFYQADVSGNLLTKQRMQVIKALIEQKKVTVITSTGGCMDYLLPLDVLRKAAVTIRSDSEVDIQELSRRLAEMGYERVGQTEASGQFAVRGDIIDVFPLTEEDPWRIELWDNQVDSIRSFDAESQRSIDSNLDEITIYPAVEEIGRDDDALHEENEGDGNRAEKARVFYRRLTDTFADYFPEGSVFFLDEPARLFENAGAIAGEYQEAMKHRLEEGRITSLEANRMMTADQLAYDLSRKSCVALSLMEQHHLPLEISERIQVTARSVGSYNNQFPMLVNDLKNYRKNHYRTVLLSASRTRGKRLAENLVEEGLPAFFSEDADRAIAADEIMVTRGNVRRGFEYPMQKFVLITESDIFGAEKRRSRKKKPDASGAERIRSFADLTVGDYVVHENHGLGIYRGIEKVVVDHVAKDYIKIEYAGGSNLYVLATQLDSLQKYSGSEPGSSKRVKINTLGGRDWSKTRSKVRGAVKNIAKELVALYASRERTEGYQYGPDTEWQREFEEMFPFEETEDQLQAIEDTKRDMESRKAMDRLICGDVGYGKTEIAIRAAFKAVQENKQVVLLCPTTILAQQHYNTFTQRMKDFPVRIDMLSRFRTSAQQKKTIEAVRKGMVDILIGTHRVLSKDVTYKDLGLLIIDEEQRFGVTHKEKIKQLKRNVDVLTLTATPIPRTLHMSLIGIRDMSVLEEPPLDRMPIQTYVMEYDEELVREAISRELARDGQVFFVYNRVNGIADMAARIQELVPDAEVAYAHGKMKENELEKIMYRFINGEIDVLVSTTIIETGMDISNVNTLIVCDADRLGLSQLYQLRGRVGRSNRNAYAFLMYRRNKMLKEDAEKRLHAIREFTELGSGVKIAMRDLEIRGAGNLLGAEQSGHMEAVGYDLYCKMLNEAVREAKGGREEADFETTIDLSVDAFIPESYIPEEGQKLDIYKRIAGIETSEEADEMISELLDRYGEPPESVTNLVSVSLLKADAHRAFISEIKQTRDEVRITLFPQAEINGAEIPKILEEEEFRNRLFFKAGARPYFSYLMRKASDRRFDRIRKAMSDFAAELQKIRIDAGK